MLYVLRDEKHWKEFENPKDCRDWFYHVVSKDPKLYLEFLGGATIKDMFHIYGYRVRRAQDDAEEVHNLPKISHRDETH